MNEIKTNTETEAGAANRYQPALNLVAKSAPNRLGLDYVAEEKNLPYYASADDWHTSSKPIWDVHNHISDLDAAKLFFEVADVYGIERVWTMAQLEVVDEIKQAFGDRIQFIAIPNFAAGKEDPDAFAGDWLKRIEQFRERGSRIVKLWAAPRGRDLGGDALLLDSPIRREGIKLARSLDMMFMVHISDPDTWFATHYKDSEKYGTKAQQYEPLERLLDEYGDVPWIAAHMGGDPEDLEHLQRLLDAHKNLYLDTSATKWMVRELSKHPDQFLDFCKRNAGRVLFGSDIVATTSANTVSAEMTFDLVASRWWALRTLFETNYDGPSPIVDPDLHLVDPQVSPEATATLRGAKFDQQTLESVYHDAAKKLLSDWV